MPIEPAIPRPAAAALPSPAGQAVLDDAQAQAAYTTWQTDAAGRRIATSHFQLSGLWCAACAGVVEQALGRVPGVVDATVVYATQRAAVRWEPAATAPSKLVAAVAAAGYAAAPDAAEPARALRRRESRDALWRLFVAGFCMMQVMMYAAPAYVADADTLAPDLRRLLQWASWLLCVPVVVFSAAPLFRDAWHGLRRGEVRMELPSALAIAITFVASTGAAFDPGGAFGHEVWFDSLAMFVTFLLGARWLTMKARHRVAGALEDAQSRLPQAVRRVAADGSVDFVAPGALRVGDRVRVLAGEAFPADGALLEGRTHADEALLTGESTPVPKAPGEPVLAGSLNLGGAVLLRVERLGADTRLEAVVALMRTAFTERPRLLQAADRIARPFLWAVLALAALAAAAWSQVDPSRALGVAVAVLVVTCPCALSLAGPSALLAAAGALARRGVLVQRLDAFEPLATLDRLFFDKTGTLTEDRLTLRSVEPQPAAARWGLTAGELLRRAASLAALSTHPLSRALADAAPADTANAADAAGAARGWSTVQEAAGRGLQAVAADGSRWRLGAADWAGADVARAAACPDAQVWLGVGRDAGDGAASFEPLAAFVFDEALRPDAAATLETLRAEGIRLSLLSGDTPARAARVAARLGLADHEGGATPEAKLARIAAAQAAGERVGMVGDGLNDAPVIARADVSFAFAAGSAIARSKADFILLAGRLGDVAAARDTARRALCIVRQNLYWAAAYNLICVPLALAGLFPPWAAAVGMAASSLAVVGNAMRVGRRAAADDTHRPRPTDDDRAAAPAAAAAALP